MRNVLFPRTFKAWTKVYSVAPISYHSLCQCFTRFSLFPAQICGDNLVCQLTSNKRGFVFSILFDIAEVAIIHKMILASFYINGYLLKPNIEFKKY
jgi:hypothetical protein